MKSGSIPGYEVLTAVQASLETRKLIIGEVGLCRFCRRRTKTRFRTKAHTFPEALGNKWVFSRDECPECNELFGSYETELAASVGPVLTTSGIKGKKNKVRQTGMTGAPVTIRRTRINDQPRLSYQLNLNDRAAGTTLEFYGDRSMQLTVPCSEERFRPRLAYKALAKMGFALLPPEEWQHFEGLRIWLQKLDDREPFRFLEVGLSCVSPGNAPPLVAAALLRRLHAHERRPYMLFLFCAGSLCWQIDLMPDALDDHLGCIPFGVLNIRWRNILSDGAGEDLVFDYGAPASMDWSGPNLVCTPIRSIENGFNDLTGEASIVPKFRRMHPGDHSEEN